MKSNKRRKAELRSKKLERAKRREHRSGVPCNPANFSPDGSYSTPDFVERGYYVDKPFECVDCGKAEVWSAWRQKWWCEVAKGNRWTTARRRRLCRRKVRERKNEARRVSLEGTKQKGSARASK